MEFERNEPLADPLTGWNGSGDTRPQIRLEFAEKDDAIAYCKAHEFDYHVVPASAVSLKIQTYADNFR